jgi:hypothetical protein
MQNIFKHNISFIITTLFILFVMPQVSFASILDPGNINTCGELAAPGTYTFTNNIDAGGISEICFIITSDGVDINMNTFSLIGSISFQDMGGGSPTWTGDDSTWGGSIGFINFEDQSVNQGNLSSGSIFGIAFLDSSSNQGTVTATEVYFSVGGYNIGTVNADYVEFDSGGYNDGIANGGSADGIINALSISFLDGFSYGIINGDVDFTNMSYNYGNIIGNVIFNDSSYQGIGFNNQYILGDVTFNGDSYLQGTIEGNATFNDLSYSDQGSTITGNATFNGSSSNGGVTNYLGGETIFNEESFNVGEVLGDAIFSASSFDSNTYGMFAADPTGISSNTGTISGTITFSSLTPVTFILRNDDVWDTYAESWIFEGGTPTWEFNNTSTSANDPIYGNAVFNDDSYSNTQIMGDAIFNDTSYNLFGVEGDATFNDSSYNADGAYVTGDATFNDSSYNEGTVDQYSYVYYPAQRPLGGSLGSEATYFNYPTTLYFNDKDTDDGDWNNADNWWLDEDATDPALTTPFGSEGINEDVIVLSNITTGTTTSILNSITFEDGVTNTIDLTATEFIFKGTSSNTATLTGDAVFENDASSSTGTITGTVTRLYNTPTTTTRNFLTDAGRNDWIVIADGVQVNITNATYDNLLTTFQTLNGGSFFVEAAPAPTTRPRITGYSPASRNNNQTNNNTTLQTIILENRAIFEKALFSGITLPQIILDILNLNPQTNTDTQFTRDLELNTEGDDVKLLQQILIQKGYDIPAGPTGFFGNQTRQALIKFQQDNNITPAAGYFGPITRARILQ